MCNPLLAVAAVSFVGSAVSAVGQAVHGMEAQRVANFNAGQTEAEGIDSLNRGAEEESRYRRDLAQVRGSQNAAFGAANVTRTGTALDLLTDTALLGSQDIQTIRNNARRTWGTKLQEAAELRRQGATVKRNSRVGAASTLLTGGANAYGIYKS